MSEPALGRCHRCGAEDGKYVYGPLMHPGGFWCERCLVETRLNEVRRGLRELVGLERKLAELGGPAERVLCGPVSWMVEGDPSKFGQFCWANEGHTGFHEVAT